MYGSRLDLPQLHVNNLTNAGYLIISFDYPLAPAAKIDIILKSVIDSINHYILNWSLYVSQELPYFLWGRSAGAYLCLLASIDKRLLLPPRESCLITVMVSCVTAGLILQTVTIVLFHLLTVPA